jgi:hypothetical protein
MSWISWKWNTTGQLIARTRVGMNNSGSDETDWLAYGDSNDGLERHNFYATCEYSLVAANIFNLLPLFWNINVGLCELHPVCLYIPLINFWTTGPVFTKLGMYIMANRVHHNGVFHKSLPSVRVSRQESTLPRATVGLLHCFRSTW